MNADVKQLATKQASTSVLVRMGQKFGVDPDKMLVTLKATAFRGEVSNEQMMALLMVADQYDLNPWTKEIFAFPDRNNGIVPVVGVDGWSRIINSNPQFDGMEFTDGELNAKSIPSWIECTIHRKDRAHPISCREYFEEVYRDVGPWKTHPRRMLRHKAMIQTARLAFGFVGVYDQDEAERIVSVVPAGDGSGRPDTSQVDYTLRDKWYGQIVDTINDDTDEYQKADAIRAIADELNRFPDIYTSVLDKLAFDKVISKAKWRETLKHYPPATDAV